ncbi:MAG: hypothetical protein ACYCZM_11080 [Acidimicrobiales bacterium]
MPPDPNRGLSFPGRWVRLGGRKAALPACRDEVLEALEALSARSGRQVFTVREVFVKMAECGTRYAVSTVLKTMQRMKEPPTRPPYTHLERVGRQGFWLGVTPA